MKLTITLFSLLLNAFTAHALELNFGLGPESTAKMTTLAANLDQTIDGFNLHCNQEGPYNCKLTLSNPNATYMESDFLSRPFSGELFIYRHYAEDPEIQKNIFDAMGHVTGTNDHQGVRDERRLELDNESLRLRCTRSRDQEPIYKCWTLILTKVLDLTKTDTN